MMVSMRFERNFVTSATQFTASVTLSRFWNASFVSAVAENARGFSRRNDWYVSTVDRTSHKATLLCHSLMFFARSPVNIM